MLIVEYAKDPVWATENNDAINLTVKFEEFTDEMPFTATSYDSESYGVQLFNNALNGDYGNILPYVPPAPITPADNQPIVTGATTL